MIWLLLHPSPAPSPVRKLDRRHAGILRKRDILLTGKGGWARSQIIRPQESLVLLNFFASDFPCLDLFSKCSASPIYLFSVLFLPDPPFWYMFCYPFRVIHLNICSLPSLYLFISTFVPVSVCNVQVHFYACSDQPFELA
jgi:hypothetical protein